MQGMFTNLLAGVASLAMATAPALADSLFPAAGELWPNDYLHFFSTDMRPVHVTLRRDKYTNDGEQVTITLPRAWITFASGYDPLKLNRLPDVVETTALGLALAPRPPRTSQPIPATASKLAAASAHLFTRY